MGEGGCQKINIFVLYNMWTTRSVATRLRCGGIVNDRCSANFLEIVTVKEFL